MMSFFGTALVAAGLVLGQPRVPSGDSVIQVDNKARAMSVLREGGVKAVEVKARPFVIPNARIDGIDKPPSPGGLVELTADVDRSQFSDSLASVKYQWVVLENGKRKADVVQWPDGSKIFFAAGVKGQEYTVILDIDCLFEAKDGQVIKDADVNSPELIVAKVVVGEAPPGPNPGPNPNPTPTPDPTFPDGKYKLAAFAYAALKADPNLSQDEKAALGAVVAAKLEGVASQIGALDSLKDPKAILKLTGEQVTAGFAESKIDIAKTQLFKTKLGDKIFELYKDKNVNTAEDFQTAWRELALGLKSFK
jgi:hypothetical protein